MGLQTGQIYCLDGSIEKASLGGTWVAFTHPSMELLPGTYKFVFKDGSSQLIEMVAGEVVYVPSTLDTTPPTTTVSLSGTLGENGWYTSDVTVTLTATDDEGGSGVKEIHYILDGGEEVVSGNSASFTISDEGVYTLEYWAVDNAGNEEEHNTLEIKIDKTPPVVEITVPADGGVYLLNQEVYADWSVTDDLSGVAFAEGTVASGETVDTSTVGERTFTVTATDLAGNKAEVTVTYHVEYGFNGLLPPYKKPPKTFKVGRSIPLKWRYTDYDGKTVDSALADPCIEIRYGSEDGELIEVDDPGASGLRYDPKTMTWHFNWKTKGLAPGVYYIYIKSSQTGQTDGPFQIQLRK